VRRAGKRCEGRKPYGQNGPEQHAAIEHIVTHRQAGDALLSIADGLNVSVIPTRRGTVSGTRRSYNALCVDNNSRSVDINRAENYFEAMKSRSSSSRSSGPTFSICVVSQATPGEMSMESLFVTRDESEVAELKAFLSDRAHESRRESKGLHNARPVVVVHVDEEAHEKWCSQDGPNGLKSRPVKIGQTFPSAVRASGWLGLRHNEVAMQLSRAEHTGEKMATVRGITFRYSDSESKGSRKK